MNRRLTKVSKYLSFVLRHHPEAIGLKLDPERWANVEELVQNANASGKSITLSQVKDVVTLDEQKMFALSEDGLRIRAN
ncbi:MAG: RNA 2'-phosphotransferase [Mariniblastus sp.]|nr:RNA 2'-phosphotransferase [Mariniblastus sp.]